MTRGVSSISWRSNGRKALSLRALTCCLTFLALMACRESEPVVLLDPYESAEVAARAFNFQIYPKAKFDESQTRTFREAHFVMNPDSAKAPPMAIYLTDDSIDTVAGFYATKYGYGEVAESADSRPVAPPAFFTTGDFDSGLNVIAGILEKLGRDVDLSNVSGKFRGAHISPTQNMPRVTLQRPYVDYTTGQVVDRTMILMVRE